jgi:hypothetical protein
MDLYVFSRKNEVNIMRAALQVVTWAVGVFTLANTWVLSPIGSVLADGESRPTKSARGGTVATIGAYQFEVFFYTTGLRVFPRDSAGAPIDASKLTGTATFYHPNSPEPWFGHPLHASASGSGQASESLDLAIGLSTVPPSGAKVAFEVAGLPNPAMRKAQFALPFAFVEAAVQPRAARPAPAVAHGYAPIASEARYFPFAGFWNTPVGMVLVPAPGYYHVIPTQYNDPWVYRPPTDWRLAHPAPSPVAPVTRPRRPDMSGIHTDYFWHPRAMDNQADHDRWIRRQLEQKYGRGAGY